MASLPRRRSIRCLSAAAHLLVLLTIEAIPPAWGQSAGPAPRGSDSARVDSARVPRDGAAARALSGFSSVNSRAWRPIDPGRLVLPVATTSRELAHLLAEVPGSFLYDLGTPGWPHGWSPDGLAPHQYSITVNRLSYVDPATGSPRLDLAPLAFVRPIALEASPMGAALDVGMHLRTYGAERPLTELRFQRGAGSFQSIEAVHVQNRTARMFGQPGRFQVLGGYAGRAAAGEYPGSRLRRARQVLGRVRFRPGDWLFELYNHHSRHRVGAHAGVLPRPGEPFESIYNRFGANVSNPGARRRTVRNDLVGRVEVPVFGPFTLTAVQPYWSAQTFSYVNRPDTSNVESDRVGFVLEQPVRVDSFDPVVEVHVWREKSVILPADTTEAVGQLHVLVRDTLGLGSMSIIAAAGAHRIGRIFPAGAVTATMDLGALGVFLHASSGVIRPPLVHRLGFGSFVEPVSAVSDARTDLVRGGLRGTWGPFDAVVTGFANRTTNATELVPVQGDTARAVLMPDAFGYGGVTLDVGWRRYKRRGLYLTVQPSLLTETTSDEPDPRSGVLPRFFGTGRLGGRILLFRGDLDLDAYVEVRAWSEMRSRTLHPPTGLLILPHPTAQAIPSSSTVGLYVEAGIREATVFLAYENILSGTNVLAGNMNVPVYPLAERHFRFGVYWPVWD